MDEKEYVTLRIPRKILLFIYILLCIVVALLVYNYWPRYVVINPPLPDKGVVLSEEKAVYNPYTSGGIKFGSHNTWTWRRKYAFFPAGDDLYTSETAMAYFDKWLNEHGWKKFKGQGSPCDVMVESDLLEKDSNLLAYVPENTTGSYYSSVVCMATWPYITEDDKSGFTVLLFTASK